MRRVIVVQARMTSTRLPGKVLLELAGRPMLEQQIRRLQQCKRVDEIVVATTTNATDKPVADLARRMGIRCVRGDEHNVLERYALATKQTGADIVIRSTADCPLIDAAVVDRVIYELESSASDADYASNVVRRTYPKGLDIEALFADTLFRVHRLAQSQPAREHVTYFIHAERPDLFLVRSVVDSADNSDLSWTVDLPADFARVQAIYHDLGLGEATISYEETLAAVRRRFPPLSASAAE